MPKRPRTIVGLDFETHYDTHYSLKKMSTSEYVRDERFQSLTCAIRTNRQKRARVLVGHDAIAKALAKYDWSKTALLAHHAHFDGLILSHHYGIVPAYYYCSMSMARACFNSYIGAGLDEVAKYTGRAGKQHKAALDSVKGKRLEDLTDAEIKALALYNGDDVDDMWHVFRHMLEEHQYPQTELDLIDVTVRMFADPVLEVDVPRAQKELERERNAKKKLMRDCAKLLDIPGRGQPRYDAAAKVLGSNDQFAQVLRDNGVDPPMKISKRTGKPTYAFAKNDIPFQKLEAKAPAPVKKLIAGRKVVKSSIGEARAEALLQRVSGPGWRLPVYLNYAKAHTLRWTGGDKLNPQNFPAGRKGQSSELRKSIIAPRGQVVVVVDSSQIEDRMNCWVSDQNDVLELYRNKEDVYSALASQIYGRPINKKDHPTERFVGKVARLGLGYGMGADNYQQTLEAGAMGPPVKVSHAEAAKVVKVYRRANREITGFWRFMGDMLKLMLEGGEYDFGICHFHPEGVDLPNGLTLHYPNLRRKGRNFEYWQGKYYTKIYGGLFTENLVQCLARIVVAEQMLMIAEHYRPVMMTHDEVVFLAPQRKAEQAYHYGLECLRTPLDWCLDIPLDAEGGWAKNYSK